MLPKYRKYIYVYAAHIYIFVIIILAAATYEDFKNAHEHSTVRMRLGLRVSLLIGNIQICILGYILQLRPIIIISFHAYVRVLRITH